MAGAIFPLCSKNSPLWTIHTFNTREIVPSRWLKPNLWTMQGGETITQLSSLAVATPPPPPHRILPQRCANHPQFVLHTQCEEHGINNKKNSTQMYLLIIWFLFVVCKPNSQVPASSFCRFYWKHCWVSETFPKEAVLDNFTVTEDRLNSRKKYV